MSVLVEPNEPRREAQQHTPLSAFLAREGLTQREVARGIEVNESFISRLAAGKSGARLQNVNAILTFLSKRLGRHVTYEDVFGWGQHENR